MMMNLRDFAKLAAENMQVASKAQNSKAKQATLPKTKVKGQRDLSRRYNTTTPYGA